MNGPLHLKALADLFQVHNQSENKSPRTIEWYSEMFRVLFDGSIGFDPTAAVSQIIEADLRAFIVRLANRERSGKKPKASTVANRVRALRAFFRWIYEEGYSGTHLLARYRPPRVPQSLVETLTDAEVNRIFEVIGDDLRNRAIVALLLDTGLRASELVELTLPHTDIETGTVKALGKGRKERIVAFGDTTRQILVDYLPRRSAAGNPTTKMFLSKTGRPITVETLVQLMRRLKKTTGIKRLHAHLFRHSYATNFLLAGGNSLLLKQNLGHSSMAMTDYYVHLAGQLAAAASRPFSPLDAIRRGSTR